MLLLVGSFATINGNFGAKEAVARSNMESNIYGHNADGV